jgi:hypothetical protein
MPAFLISVLTISLLLTGSCSTTSPDRPKGPWSLDFKTSGGFIGIGKGSIVVDSEGQFTCSHNNRDQVVRGLTGKLNASQLQPISEAVAQLDPGGWNKPGLKVAASDAFGYNLELRQGPEKKDVSTVQWYDNTADQLPDDLKKLDAVLEQTMKTQCGGRL